MWVKSTLQSVIAIPCLALCTAATADNGGIDYGPDLTADTLLDFWLEEPTLPPPSAWHADVQVGVGAGYKKNVLYSAVHEQDSALSLAEIDMFVYRDLPSRHELYLYAFADQRHYFELDRGDNDQTAIAEVSWTRRFDARGAVNLRGTYSYIDQFFDASISDRDIDAVRIQQQDYGLSLYADRGLTDRLLARVGGKRKAVDVEDSDDDFRQWEALGQLEYGEGTRWKAGVTYRHDYDDYDERNARTAAGEPIEDEAVTIVTDRLSLYGRWYWDGARKWETRARVTGLVKDDDGGGYYDYQSWRGSLLLRGPLVGCRWEGGVYYGKTDYDVRPSRFGDESRPLLFREWWQARFRVDRDLGRGWKVFTELWWEDNDSNDPLDVYTQEWVTLGAAYRL